MSEENQRLVRPSFDGPVEHYDKWENKWGEFAKVEGLSDALGDALDPNMPDSNVAMTRKDAAREAKCCCHEDKQESNSLLGIGT